MRRRTPANSAQPKPLTKRQQQAIHTKSKIYDTAVQVINEQGFENTTIEDITTAAGVAKGSFYNYFPTKEALVLYTFQRSDEIYGKAFTIVQDLPFQEQIEAFIRLSYEKYEKRGKGIIRAITSNYFTYPEFNFYSNDRKLITCLLEIIQCGKDEGKVRTDLDNDQLMMPILAALIGTEVLWCMNTSGKRLADMAVSAVMETITGILTNN